MYDPFTRPIKREWQNIDKINLERSQITSDTAGRKIIIRHCQGIYMQVRQLEMLYYSKNKDKYMSKCNEVEI